MIPLENIMDKNQEQESPDDQNYQFNYFHELFYLDMMKINARKFIPERRRDSKDKNSLYVNWKKEKWNI